MQPEIIHSRVQTVPGQFLIALRQPLPLKRGLETALDILSATGVLPVFEQMGGEEATFAIHPAISARFPPESIFRRLLWLKLNSNLPPERVVQAFRSLPEVEEVEPVRRIPLLEAPDDSLLGLQEHLRQIRALDAWNITAGDSSVIIAIVDNGFDLDHPDIRPNLWINGAEKNGVAGRDDDGNGYVDDIYGYDFAENDPDPRYGPLKLRGFSHGTHVAGLAAATGNNEVGVAGVAWKCRLMLLKAAMDDDPMAIFSHHAYTAIAYAVANGAKVINLSWGGYDSVSKIEQKVIENAFEFGALLTAAAGNEGTDEVLYPAGYHHVISVSWVDSSDRKPQGANFGKWIDVVAPGVDVLSTLPEGKYGRKSGSSMASPIVAGVAALLWARYPDWSPFQIAEQLLGTADPVDLVNPGYARLMGSGRVNALNSLTGLGKRQLPARPILLHYAFSDSSFGNGNGLIERDETIAVYVKMSNVSIGKATEALFRLLPVSQLAIDWQRHSQWVDVPADTDFSLPDPFLFTLREPPGAEPLKFVLQYSGTNLMDGADTLLVLLQRRPILIVDDDDGVNNVEAFYTRILERWNIPFSVWNRKNNGPLPGRILQEFPIVIWFCEWAYPTLTPKDQNALSNYLAAGGSLFLTGQDIGWDLADAESENATDASRQFYRGVLHAEYVGDDANVHQVTGVPGQPIANGLAFTIYQPGRPEKHQYPDVFNPVDSAQAILEYAGGRGIGGLRYRGTGRLVYFGFGLEAIEAKERSTPEEPAPIREEVLARVLDDLFPIEYSPIRDVSFPSDSVSFHFEYAGTGKEPDSCFIHVLFEDGTAVRLRLNKNGQRFYGILPLTGKKGKVRYWFEFKTPDYQWTYPIRGERKPLTFLIGEDRLAPIIRPVPVHFSPARRNNFLFSVSIVENSTLDTARAFLHWRQEDTTNGDSISLTFNPNLGLFEAVLPDTFPFGSRIYYWFSACDRAEPPNQAISDTFSFQVGAEDFSGGLRNWEFGFEEWGTDTTRPYSEKFCVSTYPYQPYEKNMEISLLLKEPLDFSGTSQLQLQFATRFEIEPGDAGFVELKAGNGPWKVIAGPYSGFQPSWTEEKVDLSAFAGRAPCFLRFRFQSDAIASAAAMGWYIDDIEILQDRWIAVNVPEKRTPILNSFLLNLSDPFPNPSRQGIRMKITIPADNVRLMVRVYDVLGRTVFRQEWKLNKGEHFLQWDGTNGTGGRLPSGIYLVRVSGAGISKVKKIVLIR